MKIKVISDKPSEGQGSVKNIIGKVFDVVNFSKRDNSVKVNSSNVMITLNKGEWKKVKEEKKTIDDAVKGLDERNANSIKRAFMAAGVMDLYDGELSLYLQMIAQSMESKNKEIQDLKSVLKDIKEMVWKAIKELSPK